MLESMRSLIEAGHPFRLDGGLGSELAKRGQDLSSSLWSAELILNNPQLLVEVHRAYLDAGAHGITTASYQASLPGLQAAGLGSAEIRAVFEDSVKLARRACDEFLRDNPDCAYQPLVAASIGPYGAFLADGSEYRGNYGVDDTLLGNFHRQRLDWLDQAGADLIACETLPDLQETKVIASLLESAATPAWVSFCCRDDRRLQDGSSIESAASIFRDHERVIAIGVNCIEPRHATGLIKRIKQVLPDRWIVVYPNSGEQYDARRKNWYGKPAKQAWIEMAQTWFDAGASLIGGCCRVGPEEIRALAAVK